MQQSTIGRGRRPFACRGGPSLERAGGPLAGRPGDGWRTRRGLPLRASSFRRCCAGDAARRGWRAGRSRRAGGWSAGRSSTEERAGDGGPAADGLSTEGRHLMGWRRSRRRPFDRGPPKEGGQRSERAGYGGPAADGLSAEGWRRTGRRGDCIRSTDGPATKGRLRIEWRQGGHRRRVISGRAVDGGPAPDGVAAQPSTTFQQRAAKGGRPKERTRR